MKIVHFSDWHAELYSIPEADIYICTGDMLPNDPRIEDDWGRGWTRVIDHKHEEEYQWNWFTRKFDHKGKTFRKFLGSPDAPVICVRGNHDFTNLAPCFGGEVYEVQDPSEVFEVKGLRIGGFRGIRYIAGEWADEIRHEDFNSIIGKLPYDLDVVISHAPPLGLMDDVWGEYCGIRQYTSYINRCEFEKTYEEKRPRLYCFGHIHHRHGIVTWDNGTIISNAATTHNVIEIGE